MSLLPASAPARRREEEVRLMHRLGQFEAKLDTHRIQEAARKAPPSPLDAALDRLARRIGNDEVFRTPPRSAAL